MSTSSGPSAAMPTSSGPSTAMPTKVAGEAQFLARRAAVDARRRERRRQLAWLSGGVVLALVLFVAAISQSGYLDVQSIRVAGVHHVAADDVLRAAALRTGQSMIGLDTGAAALRVERLPWVESAHVQRHWPHDVVIVVDEYRATAWFRVAPRTVALVGRDDRVVAHADSAPPGLPLLTGLRVLPPVGALVAPAGVGRVYGSVPQSVLVHVASVDVSGSGLALRVVNGPTILLGNAEQLHAKAVAAWAVLHQLAGMCTRAIDVSVPGAPVTLPC
jgi:cell division protein FtsQ